MFATFMHGTAHKQQHTVLLVCQGIIHVRLPSICDSVHIAAVMKSSYGLQYAHVF